MHRKMTRLTRGVRSGKSSRTPWLTPEAAGRSWASSDDSATRSQSNTTVLEKRASIRLVEFDIHSFATSFLSAPLILS